MINRLITGLVQERLTQFPAVALLGARQVGKTTLAKSIVATSSNAVYLDLERPSDAAKLAEPELFLQRLQDRLVVLDEIQRVPKLFPVLRSIIDLAPRPGRFLLLGSAAPALLQQGSESLAGRIAFVEMEPLLVEEVKPTFEQLQTLWLRGGFPSSFLARDEAASYVWRESFIQTFLERDIPQLGIRVPPRTLHRFWRMLAHHHGQLFNASQLGAAFGVAHTTVQHYLDILEGALVVRRLEPLHVNLGKRLTKSPKIYLRDAGLLHALLGIRYMDELQGHPVIGHSWEGFVIEQIWANRPPATDIAFFRTAAGAEIDLVLSNARRRIGVEIKFSSTPSPTKGFWNALEDLGVEKAWIVAPVQEPYPLTANVEVISPLHLSQALQS
ncbi:MAG TPA: ATP-binding protein [Burkholderiales bacterium]|nr:ATP-binding protein [Burkholderiales bacterium]